MADISIKKAAEIKNLKTPATAASLKVAPGISGGDRGIKPRIPEPTIIEKPKMPNGGETPLRDVIKDKNIGRR